MELIVERLCDDTVHSGRINVVIVDFQPLSALNSLAAELTVADEELAIQRIDAVRDLAGTYSYHGLSELAEGYARLLATRRPVDCVVGYCSACGLAERIALALGGPPVVLVKPTRPTVRHAIDDFAGFLAKLRSSGSAVAVDLTRGGQEAHAAMNGELAAALAAWSIADDMDADELALLETELLARFNGWLAFLLATAATPGPVPLHRTAVVPGRELDEHMVLATATRIRQIVADERNHDDPPAH